MDWLLKVVRVGDNTRIPPGERQLVNAPLAVGRGVEADWVLADPSVSRIHARFTPGVSTLRLEPADGKAVRVDGTLISGAIELVEFQHIQIGGVLLRVFRDVQTDPPPPVMSVSSPADVVLEVDDATGQARLFGEMLDLRGAAARALLALARSPGEWVERDAIASVVWAADDPSANPLYVEKYVSMARKAVRDHLRADPTRRSSLVVHLVPQPDPAEDLARLLLSSRRGFGYRLAMAPRSVRVRKVG